MRLVFVSSLFIAHWNQVASAILRNMVIKEQTL